MTLENRFSATGNINFLKTILSKNRNNERAWSLIENKDLMHCLTQPQMLNTAPRARRFLETHIVIKLCELISGNAFYFLNWSGKCGNSNLRRALVVNKKKISIIAL